MAFKQLKILFFFCLLVQVTRCKEIDKDQVDKVIEDEITQKLSEDLLQSIEKKFNVDLEKAVDQVLSKIKLLLQNGTTHIQDKLGELQSVLNAVKKDSSVEAVDGCLAALQNDTTALAEKALHQMVVCGYALIGHDPAQAIRTVMELKAMIKLGLKPIYNKRDEVFDLLRVCGHDHDSLKKVIKCVISKSPQLKSAMMSVSGKLIDGVIYLTKQMAHGAMHEACLIEVINTVEDEAFGLIEQVRMCTFRNSNSTVASEMEKMLKDDNATVLDINKRVEKKQFSFSADKDALPVDKLKKMMHESTVKESLDKITTDLLKPENGAGDNNNVASDGKNAD